MMNSLLRFCRRTVFSFDHSHRCLMTGGQQYARGMRGTFGKEVEIPQRKVWLRADALGAQSAHVQFFTETIVILSSTSQVTFQPSRKDTDMMDEFHEPNADRPGRSGRSRDVDDIIDDLEGEFHQRNRKDRGNRQESAAMRTKVKRKIIQRKYFKEPQEVNLLTWEAKEQIRYLNAEYPEEWGIDQLAESFPITSEGVVRLLKSKWVPRNIDELIQHDTRVQKNWKALKSDERNSPRQYLQSSGKLHLMNHASGNALLPQNDDQMYLPSEERSPPGLFETLYLQTKGIDIKDRAGSDFTLKQHLDDNAEVLMKLAFDGDAKPVASKKQSRVERSQSPMDDSQRHSAVLDADESVWQESSVDSEHGTDYHEDPGMAGTGRIK